MPPYEWPREPMRTVQGYEGRRAGRGDTGALIMWAVWAIDGLHYLGDLDDAHHQSAAAGAHIADVINMAHARWATGTAVTALDLCAAVLGRECCGVSGPRELDLRSFDTSAGGEASPRAACRPPDRSARLG